MGFFANMHLWLGISSVEPQGNQGNQEPITVTIKLVQVLNLLQQTNIVVVEGGVVMDEVQ